jgi:lysophospholipase L1-like esterase
MNLPRLVVSAICAVILSGAAITAASPASAATVSYVALGDSYSSGVGAGSYDSSGCQRSTNAYPAKWAAAHSPASFSFVACSGATTGDVLSKQLGALSSSTTLASITIGGNDAGFSGVMQTCVLYSTSSCLSAIATSENYMDTQLPGKLSTLFTAIHSKASAAQVIVLDYPHLYVITSLCAGLNNTKRTALNGAADKLDTTIAKATADAGFAFADVRSKFSGHELCSGDGWLHSVTIPFGESYHPTATGHALGYLPIFTSAVAAAAG